MKNQTTLRVYDNKGRERFMRAGQVVPVGWFDSGCELITEEMVVKAIISSDGNLWNEGSERSYQVLCLVKNQ